MPAANFPDIEPTQMSLESVDDTRIQRTLSGRETRTKTGTQYYRLSYDYEALTESQKRQIAGHYANARGRFLDFVITLPDYIQDGAGVTTATITCGTAAAGVYSVGYTKSNGDNETVFKAGDIIRFSNDYKLYEVTADSTSVGVNGTVTIYPALRTAVTSSQTIKYQDVDGLFRYAENLEYELRNDSYSSLTIVFEEVIS